MNDIVGPLADRPCHSDCIPRSSLPRLPEGCRPPFRQSSVYSLWVLDGNDNPVLSTVSTEMNQVLIALLNAVYGEVGE